MAYSVGEQICDGMLAVVSVDDAGNITAVVPADKDWLGNPLTISYSPSVTEALIKELAAMVVADGAA